MIQIELKEVDQIQTPVLKNVLKLRLILIKL